MPKIVLMEMDIWGALVRAAKPKSVKGKPVPFTVSLNVASHKMAQKLNQILAQVDKIEAVPEVTSSKKMRAALGKLRAATGKLIDITLAGGAFGKAGEALLGIAGAAAADKQLLDAV